MLRLSYLIPALIGLLSLPSLACPDLEATGDAILPVTAPNMVYAVKGIGGNPVEGCAAEDTPLASLQDVIAGRLPANPTVVWEVQNAKGADLIFSTAMTNPETQPGEGILLRCDTVMMIQAPDGTLAFSDDDGSANLSLLVLPRMMGTYKIWVGAYSEGASCEGEVRLADADLACPGVDRDAIFNADNLSQTWTVTAGGPRDVRGCAALKALVDSDLALGFIDFAPTLDMSASLPVGKDGITIAVDAICDTVLIGLDGNGNWYFSDDVGEDLNPSLSFSAEDFTGAKIWVGTYDIAPCDVDLSLGQRASTTCPNPDLPVSASANLGLNLEVSSDGGADLSACSEALGDLEYEGFTSLSPAASIQIDSLIETPSLTLTLTSTCNGQILTHSVSEEGQDIWTLLTDLPFGSDTLALQSIGTHAFWLVSETPEACSGTLTLESAELSCPNPDLPGKEAYTYALDDLIVGQRLPVIAGGKTDITNCTVPGLSANGTYIDRPDFVIETDVLASVIFESEGPCDTTLIVRDGEGTWHYSDDDAPDSNGGAISLKESIPGPYQIWVGTYGQELCESALLIKRGLFKE